MQTAANLCAKHGLLRNAPRAMARHEKRRVSGGNRIAYRGREYVIASTTRKHVWLVIHPDRFYVVDRDPLENRTQWPRKLAEYRQ